MNLTEIKEKITQKLNKITKDDFYADTELSFLKEYFLQITDKHPDQTLEDFLIGKFPEMEKEMVRNQLLKEISNLDDKYDQINKELKLCEAEIKNGIWQSEKKYHKIFSERQSILEQLEGKRVEIGDLEKEENNFITKKDFEKIQFLFKILLKKNVVANENLTQDYERIPRFYYEDCGIKEFWDFVQSLINSQAVIPNDWRKIISNLMAKPIPQIAGQFYQVEDFRNSCLLRANTELTGIDASVFLAMKMALDTNHAIQTESNKIILALSGGVSSTISFRKKGELISKFQKHPFEIFTNHSPSGRFLMHTLYHKQGSYTDIGDVGFMFNESSGYTGSEIKIELPNGYYILSDDYVIEINLSAAPILL